MTTISLALVNPDGSLQQVSKSTLRNQLIDESKTLSDVPNGKADWFIDGMGAVNAVNVAKTCEDYATSF